VEVGEHGGGLGDHEELHHHVEHHGELHEGDLGYGVLQECSHT